MKYNSWPDEARNGADISSSSKPSHQIVGSAACTDDGVVFSIASLLVTLVEGTSALYQMSRYNAGHGMTPLFSNGSFLLRLIL